MFNLMVVSSFVGGVVALLGFSSYASDIQLTIAFVGCAWCLISAGIAGVLQQLTSLQKHLYDHSTPARAKVDNRPEQVVDPRKWTE